MNGAGGREAVAREKSGLFIRALYNTSAGRAVLRVLCSRRLSRAAGAFLNSRASRMLIGPFVRSAGVDLSEYDADGYSCFNDFFTRRIKPSLRPVESDPDARVAPCDGLVSVYPIGNDPASTVVPAKQSEYSVASLVGSEKTARLFAGGFALVFRLRVGDHHRYIFADGGMKRPGVFIPGKLHTVRPVALSARPVFVENCREVTLIDTDGFGALAQIEIGAMLVGRIVNHRTDETFRVERGEEKGMFMYGGSTVVMLVRRGAAQIDTHLTAATRRGLETPVCMGERIGSALRTRKD